MGVGGRVPWQTHAFAFSAPARKLPFKRQMTASTILPPLPQPMSRSRQPLRSMLRAWHRTSCFRVRASHPLPYLGGVGLAAFLWAMWTRQFDDLDRDAKRGLIKDWGDPPKP